jgi:hypothetical protein
MRRSTNDGRSADLRIGTPAEHINRCARSGSGAPGQRPDARFDPAAERSAAILKLEAPLNDDLMAYVVERYRLEDWREVLVWTNKTLKRNRALEAAKIHGLLVVSIDANEQFNSRHRCCEACCRRKVKIRNRAGQDVEVEEFSHRMVYPSIHGPLFGVVLDVEPIRPGEDEAAAALRMLGRMRRLYGPRFFDVVTVDAWYTKTLFIRAVRRLGWGVVSVLKQERFNAYQEASTLAAVQAPEHCQWEDRQIALREVRDLTWPRKATNPSGVLADEDWIQTNRIAGRRVAQPMKSHWRWIASRNWTLSQTSRLEDRSPALGNRKPCF